VKLLRAEAKSIPALMTWDSSQAVDWVSRGEPEIQNGIKTTWWQSLSF
jgi:hypothetical protein